MRFRFDPAHDIFVAEASGFELTCPLSSDAIAAIDQAMQTYAVLIFRNQQLDDESQLAFAQQFGPLETATGIQGGAGKRRLDNAQIADISNLAVGGGLLEEKDRRRLYNLANNLWHSDSSFKQPPAKYSMLHARIVPPEGGDTQFADMRAAYDDLPDGYKRRIDNLIAEHSILHSRAALGFFDFTDDEKRDNRPVFHPLVRQHENGRKSLFLSAHIGRIDSWTPTESLMLLRDLVEFSTTEKYVYTHKWRENDLVMWDNRTTMHRGKSYYEGPAGVEYKRDLRRVTLEGDAALHRQVA